MYVCYAYNLENRAVNMRKIFLMAVMGCFALPLFAEDKVEETKVEEAAETKPAKKIKKHKKAKKAVAHKAEVAKETVAPALPTAPSVPAVAPTTTPSATPEGFIKVNDNTFVGIHGMINALVTYDFSGYGGDELFVPNEVYSTVEDNKQKTSMHGKTSRLKFVALNKSSIGDIQANIEADFMGDASKAANGEDSANKYTFRLRHAFVTVNGFLIGHTDSQFVDFDQITTVDPTGHFGGGLRQFQVRYAHDFGMVNFGVALERPSADYMDQYRDKIQSADHSGLNRQNNLPDLTAKFGFKFGDHVLAVRGLLHKVSVKDTANKVTYSKMGYGMGLNAKIATMKNSGFVAAVTYGKGIGHYLSEFDGSSVVINTTTQKAELVKFMEWGAGYTQAFGDAWSMNIGYSETTAKTNALTQAIKQDTLGKIQRMFVNIIWSPVKDLNIGLEYAEVRTRAMNTTVADTKGKRNRISVGVQYNF
ncbi:MAG: hypothetical protein CNLJKLNK_00138 [Holosporales bacterium]